MSHWDVCTLLALHARTLHMFEPVSGIFAEGIFADGIFAEGIFAERNFRRKEFSPNGIFAERKFRRTEISPTEFSPNGIFAENQGMLISQVNFRIYAVYLFYCEIILLTKKLTCV